MPPERGALLLTLHECSSCSLAHSGNCHFLHSLLVGFHGLDKGAFAGILGETNDRATPTPLKLEIPRALTDPACYLLHTPPFLLFQYATVDDLPLDAFERRRTLYALVERVVDGDTLRVRHIPGYNWRRWKTPQPLTQRSLVDHTLVVRFYGIDCPEVAKFGKPNQPWAQEAKETVTRMVLHRMVCITLYRKDQYRRAICKVETVSSPLISWIPGFRPKDLSIELATSGLAELYTGGGAEYCVRFYHTAYMLLAKVLHFCFEKSRPLFSHTVPSFWFSSPLYVSRTTAHCWSSALSGPNAGSGGSGPKEVTGCRRPTSNDITSKRSNHNHNTNVPIKTALPRPRRANASGVRFWTRPSQAWKWPSDKSACQRRTVRKSPCRLTLDAQSIACTNR